MKNTTTQLKAFLCFLVLAMFSYNLSSAQSWDYVNFTDGSDLAINNAAIDGSDNVYTYGWGSGFTRVLRKFNAAGNIQWTKDITGLIDYSSNSTMSGGVGGVEYSNSKIYVVANKSGKGIVLTSGVGAGDPTTTWEQLGGTATSTISGIVLKNGHMYVVGYFGGVSTGSSTVTFNGSTTLTGNAHSGFVAKYTYPSKTLVWAKKIHASNIADAVNVDVDNSGNVFVSGHFRGTATFYNGTTPYSFTSVSTWTAETYLAKFNSNGDFDNTFGLKVDATSDNYNWRSYDVEVSDTNNAVYWAEDTRVRAYNKNGSGSLLWSRDLASKPYRIKTNNCGDVYVTGQAGTPVTKNSSKAPCGGDFFGVSLNAVNGTSVWPENSTSCSSYGAEVLIDSNNKEVFVGSYFSSGGSQPLVIDTFSSGNSKGYFIGRYTDDPVNSCCKATLEVGKSKVICEGDPWPVLDITGQIPNIVSINWYLNGNPFPQPVNAETITTFAAGTYSVVVVYDNGCTLTDSMTLVVEDCPAECEITPKFDVKTKYCTASFSNNSYASGATTIVGYLWDFGDGTTSTEVNPTHTYPVGGNHTVTLYVYGINEEGDCCVEQIQRKIYINVSCLPKCGLTPKFKVSEVGNGVYLFESASITNGFTTIVGYEWTINGTVVSTAPYFAQPFSGGTLCLTIYGLTSKGECCSETTCKSFAVKPGEDSIEKEFKVFPNPTQDNINFDFSLLDNTRASKEISVIDVNGRVISSQETNEAKYRIETKNWPTGLYLCKVTIDGITKTKKIIKN